ncbi:hypothetical protein F2Q68_00004375 [Brassica cretica]|uniref:Uncharacterized protein n=1 Tax=Brassica cretica TaxID=69181 RepID=A0A8S9J744_BRACR|nr:hypothetical protein F2Q68_00004375 [Brassica cretica]
MKWVRYGLRETASKGRRECMDSSRIDVSEELGRYRPSFGSSSVAMYRPSETDARSLRSDRAWLSKGRRECMDPCRIDDSEERPSGTDARSLHSDRAGWTLGLYIATERDVCSVATWRPSLARARSLRSDRATFFGLFSDVSCFFRRALPKRAGSPFGHSQDFTILHVATERDVCSVATWQPSLARARSLRSDRATFFGLFSDVSCFFRSALHIDSVVTDFDPNNGVDQQRSAQEAHLVTAKISLFYT